MQAYERTELKAEAILIAAFPNFQELPAASAEALQLSRAASPQLLLRRFLQSPVSSFGLPPRSSSDRLFSRPRSASHLSSAQQFLQFDFPAL